MSPASPEPAPLRGRDDAIPPLPLRWQDHAVFAALCVVIAATWAGPGGLSRSAVPAALLVGLCCVLVHEAGHALVAVLCRFRVRAISLGAGPSVRAPVGPIVVQLGLAPFAGAVHYEHHPARRTRQAVVAGGGAAANLAVVGSLVLVGPPLDGRPLLATAVLVNVAMAASALWPVAARPGRLASDGWELWRLLRSPRPAAAVIPAWVPPPWQIPDAVRARLAEGRNVEALALLDRIPDGTVSPAAVASLRTSAEAGRTARRAAWRARVEHVGAGR